MEKLLKKHQQVRFSGAGASHQNGATERVIKTVVTTTRTVLTNVVLVCPKDTFTNDIFPMMMDYAVWIYNRIPDIQSGLYSIDICSISRFDTVLENLSNFHIWDCTTYFNVFLYLLISGSYRYLKY